MAAGPAVAGWDRDGSPGAHVHGPRFGRARIALAFDRCAAACADGRRAEDQAPCFLPAGSNTPSTNARPNSHGQPPRPLGSPERSVSGVGVNVGPPGVIVGVGVRVGPPGVIVGVGVSVGPPGVIVGVGTPRHEVVIWNATAVGLAYRPEIDPADVRAVGGAAEHAAGRVDPDPGARDRGPVAFRREVDPADVRAVRRSRQVTLAVVRHAVAGRPARARVLTGQADPAQVRRPQVAGQRRVGDHDAGPAVARRLGVPPSCIRGISILSLHVARVDVLDRRGPDRNPACPKDGDSHPDPRRGCWLVHVRFLRFEVTCWLTGIQSWPRARCWSRR